MALERRRGTPALQDMQLGTQLPKPTCARHRQWSSLATWGSLLWYYRTSFCGHTFLSKVSVRMAFQARCSTSGSLPHAESVFQELPLWGGPQPSPISSHILVCKKAKNTGFLNDFGF